MRVLPSMCVVACLVGGGRAVDDAYTPLRLYDGAWQLGASTHIVNHCAQTGLFFVCEQVVNGTSEDLVVFMPTDTTATVHHYKTQALSAGGREPGGWGALEINGDRWVYSSDDVDKGVKEYWRTTNVFSGRDRIHFEVQHSADGVTWETKQSGDERRVTN